MTFASISELINNTGEIQASRNTNYLCQAAKTALLISGIVLFVFAEPTTLLGAVGSILAMVTIHDLWVFADRASDLAKRPYHHATPMDRADHLVKNMWLLGGIVAPLVEPDR